MKRKPREPVEALPVKAEEILEKPKASFRLARTKVPMKKCSVCASDASSAPMFAGADDEVLCWVCRRLKISAWRDTDPQMAVQE